MSSESLELLSIDDPSEYRAQLPDQEAVGDLPPSAKLVRLALGYEAPLTQPALAELTMLSPRTIRYAIERLEAVGAIESTVNTRDARQQVYRLAGDEGGDD